MDDVPSFRLHCGPRSQWSRSRSQLPEGIGTSTISFAAHSGAGTTQQYPSPSNRRPCSSASLADHASGQPWMSPTVDIPQDTHTHTHKLIVKPRNIAEWDIERKSHGAAMLQTTLERSSNALNKSRLARSRPDVPHRRVACTITWGGCPAGERATQAVSEPRG